LNEKRASNSWRALKAPWIRDFNLWRSSLTINHSICKLKRNNWTKRPKNSTRQTGRSVASSLNGVRRWR